MNEVKLLKLHDEILKYLLDYKNKHTDFTFLTRMKNNNNRLENGYWFTGAENYIFVPLYKIGCKDNKTKTIGFVVVEAGQYIEIVFKNIDNETEQDRQFHQELIEYLKSRNELKMDEKKKRQFFFWFKTNDLKMNLNFYITDFRNKAEELLKKYHIEERYKLSEEKFNNNLHRLEVFRNKEILTPSKGKEMSQENVIKNIILYGSPGVGKTHNTKKLISLVEDGKSEKEIFKTIKNNELNDAVDIDNIKDRVKFIAFHQSFGYEDFIEGFRANENGDIKLQDGIFKTICDDADNDREKNYYLIIDEINRGNISKIFGELITLIEEDKRDTLEVTLPYSKKTFKIPSNLYIIGTMNSTDKSIALIDIALRRRFTFLKMEPNLDLVDNVKAKNIMKQLNEKITETLGADYVLGHSYFMKIENKDDLDFVLEYKIKPLLEEYFYGDSEGLKQILEMIDE